MSSPLQGEKGGRDPWSGLWLRVRAAVRVMLLVGIAAGTLQAETIRDLQELLEHGHWAEASQQAARFLSTAPFESREDSLEVLVATRALVAAQLQQLQYDDPQLTGRIELLISLSKAFYGPQSSLLADAYQYAGLLERSQDDADAATEHFLSALSINESHPTPNQAERARILHNLAETYFRSGKYALAKREFERELQARDALAQDDIDIGIALVDLNEARVAVRDTAGMTAAYDSARRIFERHEGPESWRIADTFHREGVWRLDCGDIARAARALEQAISILRRSHQRGALLAECLLGRARAHVVVGESDSAIARATSARDIYVEHSGPSDPTVASCLMTIGDAHRAAFRHGEASRNFLEALSIYDTPVPSDAAALTNCLRTLASHSLDLARHDDALRYARRALQLGPGVWGGRSTETAIARLGYAAALRGAQQPDSARLHYELARADLLATVGGASYLLAEPCLRLGALARERGDLAQARAGAEHALELLTRAYGPDDPRLAECHHELGIVKRRLGDARGSRAELERALHLVTKGGRECEAEGAILSSLALLEWSLENEAVARADFQRALESTGRVRSREHPQYALILRNLASMANAGGRFSEAAELYQRALAILEPALGSDHPDVAATRIGLGNAMKAMGDVANARAQYERAIEIHREALGPDAPALALDYHNLAALLLEEGNLEAAMEKAEQAEHLGRQHFLLIARGVSEREALYFAANRVRGTDIILTGAGRSEARRDWERAWDLVILSRAAVLEEIVSRRSFSASNQKPELDGLSDRLAAASNHMVHLAVRGRGQMESLSEFKQRLAAARLEKEAAERALAARSTEFRERVEHRDVGLRDVMEVLPERSALIAWVHYERLEVVSSNRGQRPSAGVISYAAFVVDAATKDLRFVPLGPAAEIDALVAHWREQAGRNPNREADRAGADKDYAAAGRALRRAVWDPVSRGMADVDSVILVPDGALCLVNFDALPDDTGGFLIEKTPLLIAQSTERSLAEIDRAAIHGSGLLTAGAPDFATLPTTLPDGTSRSVESTIPCGQFKALVFKPLPGTERETDAVVQLWRTTGEGQAHQLVGTAATERGFRNLATGRRVLHVATHGFFLGTECSGRQRHSGAAAPDELTVGGLVAESPLLLSGLAFGGANLRAEALASTDDGILTAEEIAGLDLRGVDLAVLSACGTGLGQVEVGEGVIGLRRAFRVAGVHSLIMSLWTVEDEATVLWMQELFAVALGAGSSAAQAVRHASLEVIRDRREKGITDHPFFWGAFIATAG